MFCNIEEHPTNATKVYGLNRVFHVFGHTRLDEINSDMVSFDHLAMIDSQRCFMIDESIEQKITTVLEYEGFKKMIYE